MSDLLYEIELNISEMADKIDYLIECLKLAPQVSLSYDTFSGITSCINRLEENEKKLLSRDKDNNYREISTFLLFALNHFNKTFKNKGSITSDDLDKVIECLNDIGILRRKITNTLPYNKYLANISKIGRGLNEIYQNDKFLINSKITTELLNKYIALITKYIMIIENMETIKNGMSTYDYNSLRRELIDNFNCLSNILNNIYVEIINSNNGIAEPILNNLKNKIKNGEFDSVNNTSMVYKIIKDDTKREKLISDFNKHIKEIDIIIEDFQERKERARKSVIDVPLEDEKSTEDYNIELFSPVEYKSKDTNSVSQNQTLKTNSKYLMLKSKFEFLKAKLNKMEEKNGSLPKNLVLLYDKLESELDEIKKGNGSTIKFNYYKKMVDRKIKLSRSDEYELKKEFGIIEDNKKRM